MIETEKSVAPNVAVNSLYAASEKIYSREAKGTFQTLRNLSVVALLGWYYIAPWLTWGGRQAILFDLPARKFHLFGLSLWPQDFVFLALLLILAGLALFFFTAVAGRVWCGFACPQTVWTEAFIWMERWVEGSRAQQMKLSAQPWNLNKIRKRFTKQFLWVSFSLLTGLTFVAYFVPIRELVPAFFQFELAGWSLFWVLFYGFATYGNAGFMREQVCKYMCPYARFQSAMFDNDTLIIAYDDTRGEPRSRGKKRKDAGTGQGDCIDCGLCVQVCPTGIDIRDGLQYECIACAACIDVCNEVMDKVDQPRDLIRYSSENHDQSKDSKSLSLNTVLLRPRVIIYGGLLTLVFVAFIAALAMRSSFQVDILRDRNALYRWSDDQHLENSYQIKVMNKGQMAQRYTLSILGIDGATVTWSSPGVAGASPVVNAGDIGDFNAIVTLNDGVEIKRSQPISFVIGEVLGVNTETVIEESRFWGPAK